MLHAQLLKGADEVSLSGPAGSGKTTLMKSFICELVDNVNDVALVAPTNKAAKVLNDKGLFATTIHSQFFVSLEQRGRPPKFISAYEFTKTGGKLPEGKRDFADIIAVDEASMLNSWVLGELRKMCDQLVLVGDPHQLPPVNDRQNPAGYFNSLKHTAKLTEILRQAEGSPILDLATAIRTGKPYDPTMRQFFPELGFADVAADLPQFIAFTNKERAKLNRLIRLRHGFSEALPSPGEKVICASNFDDRLLNGTEGLVVEFKWNGVSRLAEIDIEVGTGDHTEVRKANMCMLRFFQDLQPGQRGQYDDLMIEWERQIKNNPEMGAEDLVLRYGYCITAHAAQGSEYPSVVVIDQRGALRYAGEQSGNGMSADEYVRRWMYTAITRARKELVIAPEWWANGAVVGVAA